MLRKGARWGRVLVAAVLLTVAGTAASNPSGDALVAAHLAALRSDFEPRVDATLDRIAGLDRQLLAARAYVRGRATLDDRWSWTQEEIAQYASSPLSAARDVEIARVRAAFEAANPGYTLWVNPEVRSLEVQIEAWNRNDSVAAAAQSLLAEVRTAVNRQGFAPPGTAQGREAFSTLLAHSVLDPPPTLAAPGLSAHGRMLAVDFQVWRGETTVAGPSTGDVASVWLAGGWRERLQRAVLGASRCFVGPLAQPVEPWHYVYEPEAC
jgi:hypothetical protein